MPVRSAAVGLTTEPYRHDISTRRLLAYAAGIGETNGRYFDDAAAEGIVAHPAFCVALEWPVALAMRHHPRFALPRQEALRAVHAGQDSIFHRPIRPGDCLSTVATLLQIRQIKPGALVITKFTTTDANSETCVVTSYSNTIYRGVEVEGAEVILEQVPSVLIPSYDATRHEQRTIPISREAPHVYTECAQIWNPIHTERRVAFEAGLPDIILHGTATWALAMSQLIHGCAADEPTRLQRFCGRFAAMVIPGTSMTLQYPAGLGIGQAVPYTVCNAEGAAAITDGLAVFAAS